ncbi:MAG TPA: hypothetical protein PLJ84_06245 [Bacteroidales bacterium]|nr:hypothetical protein [Bacteroidales bacterium]
MSLDTVLQIGKVLRSSENSLKYFKYIEACPKDKDGNWPICITIPVKEDFSFDWEGMKITPENQRDSLFYLKFKTSDSDGLVKYVFGDIYFERKAGIKKDGSIDFSEAGYYRLENPNHSNAAYRLSSFYRGLSDYNDIIKQNVDSLSVIKQFHEQLEKNIKYIERILKFTPAISYILEVGDGFEITSFLDNEEELYLKTIDQIFKNTSKSNLKKAGFPSELSECNETQKRLIFDLNNISIFIHFDFTGKKHWYEYEMDMDLLNSKVLSEFVDNTSYGLVLKKTLYKTLCSGDKKNDIQFPLFKDNNKHKSKNFQNDSLQDLFYAIDYTSKGKLISGTDIKLIVLPRGEHLTAKDYDVFLEKRDEAKILAKNNDSTQTMIDPTFDFFSDEENNITSFDLVFCKKGGLSSPDSDLLELSGIEKSKLRLIRERIRQISQEINAERKSFLKTEKELFPLNIDNSFREILGNPQADLKSGKVSFKSNPKYQSHLLKVLPLIYTENYYHDETLLPALNQNVEFSIRAGDPKFNFLKYDLKFLLKIQNTKTNRFMEITSSESYQIGFMLGGMAKNLSMEINSFEKNYVGNLTRRVGTLPDFIKLKNEIEQKLIMHDKTKFTFQTSYDLAQKVKEFKMRYDKEECAFGFMESYFKPLPKKAEGSSIGTNTTNNQ